MRAKLILSNILIFVVFGCWGCSSQDQLDRHTKLCDWMSKNWVGVHILYDGPQDFLSACHDISYSTEMDLIQKIRKLAPDGHFDIFLTSNHPENTADMIWQASKIVRLVVTDSLDGVTIVKNTDALDALGLKKGNLILKINGKDVDDWILQIMEMFPQSSIQESREEALKGLFSTCWKFWAWPDRIDVPLFDGDHLEITYQDTQTMQIHTVHAPFEQMGDWEIPQEYDFTFTYQGHYGTIQDYYVVDDESNRCVSQIEHATLKDIDGEKWLIYYIRGFIDPNPDTPMKDKLSCYVKLAPRADRFVLDLRDSYGGGGLIPIMFYILQADTRWVGNNKFWINGKFYTTHTDEGQSLDEQTVFEPQAAEGIVPISRDVPVYIWPNSVCGSGCDLFNLGIQSRTKPVDDNIVTIGKKTAGRIMGVERKEYNDYAIYAPSWGLYKENGQPWEGTYAAPDHEFDVKATDYQSADRVFLRLVEFIKQNNL